MGWGSYSSAQNVLEVKFGDDPLLARLVSLTQFQVIWEPLVSIRSSRPEVLCKIVALKYFENSQENACARVSLLSCWGLHFLTQVFYCEFYIFLKNAFFTEYLMRLLLNHLHFLLILAKIFQGMLRSILAL